MSLSDFLSIKIHMRRKLPIAAASSKPLLPRCSFLRDSSFPPALAPEAGGKFHADGEEKRKLKHPPEIVVAGVVAPDERKEKFYLQAVLLCLCK